MPGGGVGGVDDPAPVILPEKEAHIVQPSYYKAGRAFSGTGRKSNDSATPYLSTTCDRSYL
jgi:hypothetical protein